LRGVGNVAWGYVVLGRRGARFLVGVVHGGIEGQYKYTLDEAVTGQERLQGTRRKCGPVWVIEDIESTTRE
jgi:hypothetical protein